MSENRFSSFNRTDEVLAQFAVWWCYGNRESIIPDALAWIAELTPRTVTDDQRTRAISAAIDYRSRPADVLVDRIIDALGWTAAEPKPKHGNGCGCYDCEKPAGVSPPPTDDDDDVHRPGHTPIWEHADNGRRACKLCGYIEPTPAPIPPAPVVELTAPQLESLTSIVRAHERTPIDLGPIAFSLRSVPMVVEDMPERDGAKLDGISVLRIGGGDE